MAKFFFGLVLCNILLFLFSHSLLAQRKDTERFRERYKIPSGKVLHVKVDIDAAEVKIFKSSRDDEAWVTIYYQEGEFRVDVDFDEERPLLDIKFDKKGWLDSDNDDLEANAVIELPTGAEIDLETKIKAGKIDFDLGGLALVNFELTTWAGEVLVDFSEPNKSEMDYLEINTKIGETEVIKLGNARFRDAEINGGIGEMKVDFRGELLHKAYAMVDLDIGETQLVVPEDVGVKLSVSKFLFMSNINLPYRFEKSGRYYYSKNYRKAYNELILKVSPGLGELRID